MVEHWRHHVLGKKPAPLPLYPQQSALLGLGWNPNRHGEGPATNRLKKKVLLLREHNSSRIQRQLILFGEIIAVFFLHLTTGGPYSYHWVLDG
jgi:hypothetical protein